MKRDFLIAGLGVILSIVAATFIVSGSHTTPRAGSITGPDAVADHFSENGLTTFPYQYAMSNNTSTTTACSFQTPAATSTLTQLTAAFTLASSSASTVVTIGYGTTRTSTSTSFGNTYTIISGQQAYIVASTSPATGAIVLGPNQWVNVTMAGGAGTFSPTGQCQARFLQL